MTKRNHFIYPILIALMGFCFFQCQPTESNNDPVIGEAEETYYDLMRNDSNLTLAEIRKKAEALFAKNPESQGYKHYQRYLSRAIHRLGNDGKVQNYAAHAVHELGLSPSPQDQNHGYWQAVGPFSISTDSAATNLGVGLGRIEVIEIDPSDPNTIYVGTPSGGLWRTKNSGKTWKALTDHIPLIGIAGIAIHPHHPETIYILTGDGKRSQVPSIGVLKSTDGGITWNKTGLTYDPTKNKFGYDLIISSTNPQILMAATNEGTMFTNNGGDTWEQKIEYETYDLEFKPGDSSFVYASGLYGTLFLSKNGGEKWGNLSFMAKELGLPNLSKSILGSRIAVSQNEPEALYFLTVTYSAAKEENVAGLFYSQNVGAPNIKASEIIFQQITIKNAPDLSQAPASMAMVVSPKKSSSITIGGLDVYQSSDGGQSFKQISDENGDNHLPYVHADINDLVYQNNSDTLYVASDGGIWTSPDDGRSWSNISNGLQITQAYSVAVSPANTDFILYAAQDNGCGKIILNNGLLEPLAGADGTYVAMSPINKDFMILQTQYGSGVYNNKSFGSVAPSQENKFNTQISSHPYHFLPGNPEKIITGYNDVFLSYNYGKSWINLTTKGKIGDLEIKNISVCMSDTSISRIYVSKISDISSPVYSGTSQTATSFQWKEVTPKNIPSNSAVSGLTAHPTNPDLVWVSLNGYSDGNKVLHSTDGGATWQNDSAGLPNLPGITILATGGAHNSVYYGTDVGVYYKDDTMSSWVRFSNGLPNVTIDQLVEHPTTKEIYVATYGRGIWKTTPY